MEFGIGRLEKEKGRELKASELKPRTVVIIQTPNGKPFPFITMWVIEVNDVMVEFYSGKLEWHVLNSVQPDGSIHDDQGKVVHVYEYLGEK